MEIQYQSHRTRRINEVTNQLDVDNRVGGTSTEVVTQRIYLKLPPTTNREWHFRKERDLDSHGRGKKRSVRD